MPFRHFGKNLFVKDVLGELILIAMPKIIKQKMINYTLIVFGIQGNFRVGKVSCLN